MQQYTISALIKGTCSFRDRDYFFKVLFHKDLPETCSSFSLSTNLCVELQVTEASSK